MRVVEIEIQLSGFEFAEQVRGFVEETIRNGKRIVGMEEQIWVVGENQRLRIREFQVAVGQQKKITSQQGNKVFSIIKEN